MWVRHILRPVAAEPRVKTARIIPSHRTELNGFDCSGRPVVTCAPCLCSADLDHMAGPCDVTNGRLFMVIFSKSIPCLSKDIEERWEESERVVCNVRAGYVIIKRSTCEWSC